MFIVYLEFCYIVMKMMLLCLLGILNKIEGKIVFIICLELFFVLVRVFKISFFIFMFILWLCKFCFIYFLVDIMNKIINLFLSSSFFFNIEILDEFGYIVYES